MWKAVLKVLTYFQHHPSAQESFEDGATNGEDETMDVEANEDGSERRP